VSVKGTLFYNSISSLSVKLLKSVPLHLIESGKLFDKLGWSGALKSFELSDKMGLVVISQFPSQTGHVLMRLGIQNSEGFLVSHYSSE
jgi:hypothetical protein